MHENQSRFRKAVTWGRGKKSFSANSYQVPQQTRQIASNKIRLMLLFVLAYMFLKFYFFNYFTFLSVFSSTPIQLLPTELSSTFQKSQIPSPFFIPNNRSAVAVTPGQPGMLPNLQTGKAQTAGEPSRRGLQPREALPTTGTPHSVIPRPTKDQVREGPPLGGI